MAEKVNDANILLVIPARAGSRGIPCKNTRLLAGKPLVLHAVEKALACKSVSRVAVSSNDGEVLEIVRKTDAEIVVRPNELAHDITPLEPVVYHAMEWMEKKYKEHYDFVATIQPTCPLLTLNTITNVLKSIIQNNDIDTVISAVDDTHLTWHKEGDKYAPAYTERVCRQWLKKTFRETGGIFCTRRNFVQPQNRLGNNVELYEIEQWEALDIDTRTDWLMAETSLLGNKWFVFFGAEPVVLSNSSCLRLANALAANDVVFIHVGGADRLADYFKQRNYTVINDIDSRELFGLIIKDVQGVVVLDGVSLDDAQLCKLESKARLVVSFDNDQIQKKDAELCMSFVDADSLYVKHGNFEKKIQVRSTGVQLKHSKDDVAVMAVKIIADFANDVSVCRGLLQ